MVLAYIKIMDSSGKAPKCRNIHMTSNSHDMGIGLYPPKRLVNRYIIGISVVVRLISIRYSHFDLLQFQSQRWSDMLYVLNYSASLCSELERSAAVYSNQVNYKVIGHVNEYPTMHCFGVPRHTQSMRAFKILTEYFWKFQWKLHCGNVVYMPYLTPVYWSGLLVAMY